MTNSDLNQLYYRSTTIESSLALEFTSVTSQEKYTYYTSQCPWACIIPIKYKIFWEDKTHTCCVGHKKLIKFSEIAACCSSMYLLR